MPSSTDIFTDEQNSLANFASAMANPARIAIVGRLRHCHEACCGDIVAALPLAQATVSQHLKVLVDAGLLSTRREGHKMFYRLECERLRGFCHAFQCTLGTQTHEPSTHL